MEPKTSQQKNCRFFFHTSTPGYQICTLYMPLFKAFVGPCTCPCSRLLLALAHALVQGFCWPLCKASAKTWLLLFRATCASLCLCPWLFSPSGHPCMEFPPLLSPAGALLWPLAWHPSPLFLVGVGLQMSWTHHLWTHPLNPLFGCPGLGVALAQGLRCCCWILAGKPDEGKSTAAENM